jgi:membrane fusion protein (multidrug efflux system)
VMKKKHLKKYLINIIVVILIAIAGYYLWSWKKGGGGGMQGGGLPVVTYRVEPKVLSEDILAVGTLQANESITVKSEIAGKIENIQFSEGQLVQKGDLLLEIDSREYEQEVDRTKAVYELAQSTFQRRNDLSKIGAASKQDRDQARSALTESKASFEKANINYEKTKIQAPFDGIIGLRAVSVGDYLNAGVDITELVSINPVKVEFSIPEKYFSVLREDLPLFITVDAWPNKEFVGTIYAISPQIDPDTRNITAKAIVQNNENLLRPGMFGYLTIHISIKENALMVPEEAIIPNGDKFSLMKVVEGKVQPVEASIGVRKNGMVEIVSGVVDGDLVITAGHMKVQPGMPVTAIPDERQPQPAVENTKTDHTVGQ